MRLSARECRFGVESVPRGERPIRLRMGHLTYTMTTSEALAIANQLADAVTRTNNERTP